MTANYLFRPIKYIMTDVFRYYYCENEPFSLLLYYNIEN